MELANVSAPSYPAQKDCNSRLLAALSQDEAGLYAVYVGLVVPGEHFNDYAASGRTKEGEWVIANGAKLSLKDARLHFPGLKEENYRR
jgi:hypothetical protein|tara:strand:+ start:113 stop:376 length:264 start_codon:yes stop_codon:yes gene_type:complete